MCVLNVVVEIELGIVLLTTRWDWWQSKNNCIIIITEGNRWRTTWKKRRAGAEGVWENVFNSKIILQVFSAAIFKIFQFFFLNCFKKEWNQSGWRGGGGESERGRPERRRKFFEFLFVCLLIIIINFFFLFNFWDVAFAIFCGTTGKARGVHVSGFVVSSSSSLVYFFFFNNFFLIYLFIFL